MKHNKIHSLFLYALAPILFYPGIAFAAFQYPVQVTAYGAKCNGTSATPNDDTAAIIAAIAAAGSGGTVQFPAGVCYVSGNSSIALNDIALVGAEVAHNSVSVSTTEAGTVIWIGTTGATSIPPGPVVPFTLRAGVTVRGINFIYPNVIGQGNNAPVPPPSAAALFSDDGNAHDQVSNILFENVHVVGAYAFWVQSVASPTYGNIRFVNSDVYALKIVFQWSSVQESVVFDNFISSPSLCESVCSAALMDWTNDHGIWFYALGGSNGGNATAVGGIQASNLTVTAYEFGVLVESGGILFESMFGPTTVFGSVPYVLYVNPNGSIIHVAFSGKAEFSGQTGSGTYYTNAAFSLVNPQLASGKDHNSLSLNGFTADGVAGPFLYASTTGGGDIASISMVGVVARHYCDGNLNTDAVDISAPTTAVLLEGSQITTSKSGCGLLSVTANPYVSAGNIVGFYPSN